VLFRRRQDAIPWQGEGDTERGFPGKGSGAQVRAAKAPGSVQGTETDGSRWSVLPRPAPCYRDWDSATAIGAVLP
jgi:hypothetical protein